MTICLVLALFCGMILAADYLTPNGIASYVVTTFAKEPACVYAVSAGSFDTLEQARVVSETMREMGGAGFVAFDGKYHVLLAAYPTKQEAQSVADKGGYTLFAVRTEGLQEKDFPLRIRSSVKGLIGYQTEVYRQLYDWSVQLSEGGTGVAYVKQRVQAIRQSLEQRAEPFLSAASGETESTICNYRSVVQGILGALENLENRTCSDNVFLAELRWTYLLVLRINRL